VSEEGAALIVWVIADHRAQLRLLADLEARGVKRRSEGAREQSQVRAGGPRPSCCAHPAGRPYHASLLRRRLNRII